VPPSLGQMVEEVNLSETSVDYLQDLEKTPVHCDVIRGRMIAPIDYWL
jgi:hypothetical protein